MKNIYYIAAAIMLWGANLPAAYAAHGRDCPHCIAMQKWKAMSAAEKEAFFEERKARWESLSADEKIDMIEKHRAEKREKMDKHWESLSADEKLEYVENHMKKKPRR